MRLASRFTLILGTFTAFGADARPWTHAEDDGPYHYAYKLWLNGSLYYRSDYPRDVVPQI
jgi:hypothetical protein